MKKLITLIAGALVAGGVFAEGAEPSYRMKVQLTGLNGSSSTETGSGGSANALESLEDQSIACGNSTCLIIVDGQVWASGRNISGEAGLGHNEAVSTWQPTGLMGVSQVAMGDRHSYALKDGVVYSTGSNIYGQLATGDKTDRNSWAPTDISDVDSIVAGYEHGAAFKGDKIWSVGYDGYKFTSASTTTEWTEAPIQGVTSVALGDYHTLAIVNGELYVSGSNTYGELGDPNIPNNSLWYPTGITGVTDIAAKGRTSFYVKDGHLYATGNPYGYELGTGTEERQTSWTYAFMNGVTDIETMYGTSYVISNGSLYSVGEGSSGQHGDGLREGRMSWALTNTITNPQNVVALRHEVAVFGDGGLFLSGSNSWKKMGFPGDVHEFTSVEESHFVSE